MAKGDKKPVVMTGDIDSTVAKKIHAEQHKIGGSDPLSAADIGVVGTNLLRNRYFGNPVNQRGLTKYNTVGYAIDGWFVDGEGLVVEVVDDGLKLTNNSSDKRTLTQKLENLPAGKYAISMVTANNTGTVSIGAYDVTGEGRVLSFFNGTLTGGDAGETYHDYNENIDRVILSLSGGATATIVAVKLERGEKQTLFRDTRESATELPNYVLNETPDYHEEFLKCIQSTADPSDTYANKVIATTDRLCAYNILDNADWSNPVDQMHGYFVRSGVRMYSDPSLTEDSFVGEVQSGAPAEYVNETYGKVSGNYVARGDMSRGYFNTTSRGIDRWRTTNQVTVELEDGYIRLFCRSTSAANGMTQNIPDEKLPYVGEKLTVAVYLNDGTVQSGCFTMPKSGSREDVAIDPQDRYAMRLTARNGDAPCKLSAMVRKQKEVSIRFVALYRGEYHSAALPSYQSKGYGAELLECQRYYQLFSNEEAMPKSLVDYRPNMRVNPAVGTIDVDGVTYWYADANL